MTIRLCFMLTWDFHLNKANWFIRQEVLWSGVKVLNLNTVLAFGSFGHILLWLGKITMQNPLCHLEYKIFTFSTFMKIECSWFMLGKKFMPVLWKSSIVVWIIFCFFSCQHGLCCDWWNWENLVEFKATTLLKIIRQEGNSFFWNNICRHLLLEP